MTVGQLLTALEGVTRCDITINEEVKRVESNEISILSAETLALEVDRITLAKDGNTPYLRVTVKEV